MNVVLSSDLVGATSASRVVDTVRLRSPFSLKAPAYSSLFPKTPLLMLIFSKFDNAGGSLVVAN